MFSGIISAVVGFLTSGNILFGIGSAVVLYLLKRAKNEKVRGFFKVICKAPGVLLTTMMTSNKLTGAIWNKAIEPFFIDLIDNIVGGAMEGFFEGLHSDNDK